MLTNCRSDSSRSPDCDDHVLVVLLPPVTPEKIPQYHFPSSRDDPINFIGSDLFVLENFPILFLQCNFFTKSKMFRL